MRVASTQIQLTPRRTAAAAAPHHAALHRTPHPHPHHRWQATNAARVPIGERVIKDVFDGTEWEKHKYLGAEDYGGDVRLAFTGYADDVDIPNPIGAASGHHKMTFIYLVCLNRDRHERTRLAHINLATIVLSKDLKEFTPAVVISGALNEAENSSSLGACFRALDKGVDIKVPSRSEPVRMRGWLFSFVGDAPAVAEVAGTKASFSWAHNICNMCENAHRPLVKKPSRWLGCVCADDRNHDPGCCRQFALRTEERDVEHKAAGCSAAKLRELGIVTWEHAFVRVPNGGRSLAQQPGPKDAMHVWLEGVTKHVMAYTMYMMVLHGWCSQQQLRNAAAKFPWPLGEKSLSRPGFIPKTVFEGRGRGRGGRGRAAARGRARGRGQAAARGGAAARGRAAAAARARGQAAARGRGRAAARGRGQAAARGGTRRRGPATTPTASPSAAAPNSRARRSRAPATATTAAPAPTAPAPTTAAPTPTAPAAAATTPAAATPATTAPGADSGTPMPPPPNIKRPKKDASMPYTAHHMLVFSLMSLEIMKPFIPPNAREDHPFWEVWVQQVHILQTLMKPSFTYQELVELDEAVFRMFTKFDEVPEYKDYWRPKFHFASHAALDILRFGPPRLNWCMMYEAKNQPMKRGCKRSNFHNPPKATSKFWVESTDHALRKRRKRNPRVEPGPTKAHGDFDALPDYECELTLLQDNLDLGDEPTFHILRSVARHGVYYFPNTYALLPAQPNSPKQLCMIQQIIMVSGTIYFLVDVLPHTMIHYDQNDEMYTTMTEINQSETETMLFDIDTYSLIGMWHFTRRSNDRVSFITKW